MKEGVLLQGMFSSTEVDFGVIRKYFIFLVRRLPGCLPLPARHSAVCAS